MTRPPTRRGPAARRSRRRSSARWSGGTASFDACEDAVQEALLAAATQWPREGVPDNPRGWLITVASRRLTDVLAQRAARAAAAR